MECRPAHLQHPGGVSRGLDHDRPGSRRVAGDRTTERNIVPGFARSKVPARTKSSIRPGTSTRKMCSILAADGNGRRTIRIHKVSGPGTTTSSISGWPDLLEFHRCARSLHGPDQADPARFASFLGQPRDALQCDPLRRIRGCDAARAGTPERLDQEPIGTGPFAFVSYQKDMAIRYRKFPEYWGDRQPIDTLVFAITPNPVVRLTKLKSGECHLMAFRVPPTRRRSRPIRPWFC